MSCAFFDFGCHAQNLGASFIAWAFGWLSINFLIGLFLGSVLGARFGWLAPFSIFIALGAAMIRPKERDDESENIRSDSPDAWRPSRPRTSRRPPPARNDGPPQGLT